jgi:hypothetical protein
MEKAIALTVSLAKDLGHSQLSLQLEMEQVIEVQDDEVRVIDSRLSFGTALMAGILVGHAAHKAGSEKTTVEEAWKRTLRAVYKESEKQLPE